MTTYRLYRAALLFLAAAASQAQMVTPRTTLSVDILTTGATTVTLTSCTGVNLPTIGGSGSYLYADQEAMGVVSQAGPCKYNVTRGQLGTRATGHNAGVTVWIGQAASPSGDSSRPFDGALVSRGPSGRCVAAQQYSLPIIETNTGTVWSCSNPPGNAWYIVSVYGSSGGSAKFIYNAPAAKAINGVGASVFQCNVNCPVPVALTSGSSITAALAVTAGTSNQISQDEAVLGDGYQNQEITLLIALRSADSSHSVAITPSYACVSNGDVQNPTFTALTPITITPGAVSGRTTGTRTWTPTGCSAGSTLKWQLAYDASAMTQDVQILSVSFYAQY